MLGKRSHMFFDTKYVLPPPTARDAANSHLMALAFSQSSSTTKDQAPPQNSTGPAVGQSPSSPSPIAPPIAVVIPEVGVPAVEPPVNTRPEVTQELQEADDYIDPEERFKGQRRVSR